jgi:hypothetical protein
MTRGFGAVLRYAAIGLLLLAMLVAPLAPLTAPARASALSDHCGHTVASLVPGPVAIQPACFSGSPCALSLEWAAPTEAASRSGCPDIDGASGLGDGCMAVDCHAMHLSLPMGDALRLVVPPPASGAMPGAVLLNGIGVDPALKPPRSSI